MAEEKKYSGYGYHGGGRKATGIKRVSICISGQPEQIAKLKKMAAQEEKTVSAFILEKTGVNKMNENKWFVANDDGDIIGHDMCEAKAKALAAEMQEKEPDASWEAMNGEGEWKNTKYCIYFLKKKPPSYENNDIVRIADKGDYEYALD